jgi:ABC-2 type transport system permease protein
MPEPELTLTTSSAKQSGDEDLLRVNPINAHPSLWLSVGSLWFREIRAFYRQRSRVVGSLATPFIFWLLLGSGFSRSFRADIEAEALEFFFPGMVTMVVLFTAIFSNISIIEDRREGFLLSVLAAPVPRPVLVLGKVLGATTIGLIQGIIFLIPAPFLGLAFDPAKLPAILVVIVGMMLGLTGLSFFFAWWLNSVQGFHAIMNLVLMPLWILSGAIFPTAGAAEWMQWAMKVNPLSYGVIALRSLFSSTGSADYSLVLSCIAVLATFAVVTLSAAFYQVSRPSARHLS